ncbi:MAG: phosphoglycerate kinase [Planctomycetes bacterium]|nr:phosphoglycerate kinase [Planctomycetota bacterium]
MALSRIDQTAVAGKRVFIRADFNVPQEDDGRISDDRRIRLTIPTIESVLQRGGSVILASHLGRPEGNGHEAAFSMAPIAARLRELSPRLVGLRLVGSRCTDAEAAAAARALKAGEVVLLENLRFEAGEKKGDASLAAHLASMADVYCNDAFGASHRRDASMHALPHAFRASGKPAVTGLLLDREIRFLHGVLETPDHPFVAIIGGAKVSDKLAALRNLIGRVDSILVGGAMAYTFLKAQGVEVGRSRVQEDMLAQAREILQLAAGGRTRIELPTDHVCGAELKEGVATQIAVGAIAADQMGLDIGPATAARYSKIVEAARTIVWNGPLGAFEWKPFDAGTATVAAAVVRATKAGATSVAGGGDTAAAVDANGHAAGFSHISTGGGASLEMLEGKSFECLEAIDQHAEPSYS